MDWNVQCDTHAAATVWDTDADLTLATLTITMQAHLRAAQLPALRAAGPLGELLARQATVHADDHDMAGLAAAHAGLPNDLLNFQYDAAACAVALGWPGAMLERLPLTTAVDRDVLRFRKESNGRPANVLTAIDTDAFAERWLASVLAAAARGS